MNLKLSWSYSSTPSAQAPTKFTIQYKLISVADTPLNWAANQFELTSTSTPSITSACSGGNCTYTISNLQDNKFYDFRIITDCAVGDDSTSPSVRKIGIVCPTPNVTVSSASVSYAFTSAGGTDVSSYNVQLLASDNTVIRTTTHAVQVGTISGTFDNSDTNLVAIAANTLYKVRITVIAGTAPNTVSKVCDPTEITTSNTPPCNPATSLTACVCGEAGCTC
jgi:hypothetical protein